MLGALAPPGVTLPELLVVLALVATVTLVAVPDWRAALDDVRAWAWQRELVDALDRARARSRIEGRPVLVCGGAEGRACDPEGWADGWVVAEAGAERVAAGEPVPRERTLERGRAAGARHHVAANRGVRDGVLFDPGTLWVTPGTFTLCRDGEALGAVVVSSLGRVRAEAGDSAACPRE